MIKVNKNWGVDLGVRIDSDFIDIYDNLSEYSANRVYSRFYSRQKGKVYELNKLKRLGVKTIKLEPVYNKSYASKDLVVYSDQKKHLGKGKVILRYNEAKLMYNNYLASEYEEESASNVLKYLQIGERRFRLELEYEKRSLEKFTVKDIYEESRSYNKSIPIPIYSIDYININSEMIAIDLNEVENLSRLNITSILSTSEIMDEIEKTLIHYNNWER